MSLTDYGFGSRLEGALKHIGDKTGQGLSAIAKAIAAPKVTYNVTIDMGHLSVEQVEYIRNKIPYAES